MKVLILLLVLLTSCSQVSEPAQPEPDFGELNQNDDFQLKVTVLDQSHLEITVINHTSGYIELQPSDYIQVYEDDKWTNVTSISMSEGDAGEFIGVKENSSVNYPLILSEPLSPGHYRYIKTIFPRYQYGSYSVEFDIN